MAGAGIAFIAFFLPWFSLCGEIDVSGAQIASDPEIQELQEGAGIAWVLWAIPILAAAILLLAFRVDESITGYTVTATILGALLMIVTYAVIDEKELVSIRYGYILGLTGFAVAAIASFSAGED